MRATKVYIPKAIRPRGAVYIRKTKASLNAELKSPLTKPNTMIDLEELAVGPEGSLVKSGQVISLKASLIQASEECEEAAAVNDLMTEPD